MHTRLLVAVAALLASTPALAEPDYAAAIRADYAKDLGRMWDDFHRNPELSFREYKTAAKMAAALKAVPGMVVTEKVGGTGVVGILKNGAGSTVLIRADMDGLPVEEKSGLPNASHARQIGVDGTESPVMHACGHDTHITAMVAAARQLSTLKNRWAGTIVFVVQPAEEGAGGAKAMLADGLYTRFPKPDYALAFHINSLQLAGTVSASDNVQFSSADMIDVTIPGIGSHGAAPNLGKDPVYMASQFVIALQGLISRERAPLEPGVITVGSFHSGTKYNIISDEAKLQLTIRANNPAERDALLAGIKRVAHGIGELNGMTPDKMPVVTIASTAPATINDPELTARLNTVMAATLGKEHVLPFVQTSMWAEDFALFVRPTSPVKSYYFFVGGTEQAAFDAAKAGGPPIASHHSPFFKIAPEPSIVTGATAMTAAALELLRIQP
ncbi:M20 family metallopeptidase [soil metagenome]